MMTVVPSDLKIWTWTAGAALCCRGGGQSLPAAPTSSKAQGREEGS